MDIQKWKSQLYIFWLCLSPWTVQRIKFVVHKRDQTMNKRQTSNKMSFLPGLWGGPCLCSPSGKIDRWSVVPKEKWNNHSHNRFIVAQYSARFMMFGPRRKQGWSRGGSFWRSQHWKKGSVTKTAKPNTHKHKPLDKVCLLSRKWISSRISGIAKSCFENIDLFFINYR